MTKTFSFLVLFLLTPGGASAAVISVPADQPTIQAGMDAAKHGDTVLVSEGVYFENIRFKGKAITVASLYILDSDENHVTNTIIDGSLAGNPDSASVIFFVDGEDTTSVLVGFTITGGEGTWDASTRKGGGVMVSGGGAKIVHNHIVNNQVTAPFARAEGAAASVEFCQSIILRNNTIRSNWASDYEVVGAGVIVRGSGRVVISDNIFEDNMVEATSGTGGAVYIQQNTSVTISGNRFIRNSVIAENGWARAGAVWSGDNIFVEVIGNHFLRNYCKADSSQFNGAVAGAFQNFMDSQLIISGNRFENNFIAGAAKWGGAVVLFAGRANYLTDNYFIGNEAPGGSGGAVWFEVDQRPDSLTMINNVFYHNKAGRGAAVYLDGSVTSINNTFTGNVATEIGAAAYEALGDTFAIHLMMNTILWGDSAEKEVLLHGEGTQAHVFNSDIEGPWDGNGGASVDVIDEDPQFLDLTSFHIDDSSRCIGSGKDTIWFEGILLEAPETDIEGQPRPNPHGQMPDIGAWEQQETCVTGIDSDRGLVLNRFSLERNYPNPFNPTTTILYTIENETWVILTIHNILGQKIRTLVSISQPAGKHAVEWDGKNELGVQVSSGTYAYRIAAGGYVHVGKMMLLR